MEKKENKQAKKKPAEKKADMSAAAKKAWATRREKYGPKGLSANKDESEAGAGSGALERKPT